MPGGLPLDPDRAAREPLAAAAFALLEALRERADAGPIRRPTPHAVIRNLRAAPSEEGEDPGPVLERLLEAARCGTCKASGGDLAFIPSGGLYSGAVAAWLAAGVHAFTGAALETPALVALEESVLGWIADVLGLPPEAEGLLLSGASLAHQTAIVCARDRPGYRAGTSIAYFSTQAHHSVAKALHLAGVPRDCLRPIAADAAGRIDLGALRAAIAADRADGLAPWLIVGVAGSTDTGAVDPLPGLAAIAADCGAWLHVDAAYGGFFRLTQRGRARLAGIESADSVTVDAHKGLQLPYGVGALLVRHPGALADAHRGEGAYLRDVPPVDGLPHYFERGPELTRPFRGLLVWLPLQLHGVARLRSTLDRMLDLAAAAATRLRELPGIEGVVAPDLSIVAFRCRAGDAATEHLLARIEADGRFRLSSTVRDGRIAIRLAFLHHRTTAAHLDALVALIGDAMAPGAPSGVRDNAG